MKSRFLYSYKPLIIICLMVSVYSAFLLHKISIFPNVFVDEANGMYDAWCMAFYGVDSNLLKNPIYLPGFVGQGQSILYGLIAGCAMRLLGYNLFAYRLPLILISILNYILLNVLVYRYVGHWKAVVTAAVVGSAPYILTVSRFGMDCNIAPFMASIGTVVLYAAYKMNRSGKRTVLLIIGGVTLGLVAYSYNVGWMYLPVYLGVLCIWLMIRKRLSLKEILLPASALLITVLPIMIFAIRSNVPALNQDLTILWWTSPQLLVGRVEASFIDLKGNIAVNIWNNLVDGAQMWLNGSDGLSWNSVGNVGPYYMFSLPFFLIGLIVLMLRQSDEAIFILSQLAAMIPIMMVVTPNYNHFIFLHIPVLLTIATGIIGVIEWIAAETYRKVAITAIALTYILSFGWFCNQYFNLGRFTGWEISAIPVLQGLDAEQYTRVYFDSDNDQFLYFVRFCLPVSPYEYQETRDHPYSKTELGTVDHYANFERIGTTVEEHSLLIIEQSLSGNYEDLIKERTILQQFTFSGQEYDVYQLD